MNRNMNIPYANKFIDLDCGAFLKYLSSIPVLKNKSLKTGNFYSGKAYSYLNIDDYF